MLDSNDSRLWESGTMMKVWKLALVMGAAWVVLAAPVVLGQEEAMPGVEAQIAGAVAAAPEALRDGAAVFGYGVGGDLVALREGSNDMICLTDRPGDELFRVACYHSSLEPYMARGRELRAEGLDGAERLNQRHREADAGELEMPAVPAMVYNLGGSLDIFNAETGEVSGGSYVWAIYTPYASEESTGLPTTPQAPGAPWIMRPGTASSHIMVVQPQKPDPADG
jgi:hypothetical protein